MLWGLISVLRGLAATSQTQILVPRPQRQTYVTRVQMNTGSVLLRDVLYRSGRPRGMLTMNMHTWHNGRQRRLPRRARKNPQIRVFCQWTRIVWRHKRLSAVVMFPLRSLTLKDVWQFAIIRIQSLIFRLGGGGGCWFFMLNRHNNFKTVS